MEIKIEETDKIVKIEAQDMTEGSLYIIDDQVSVFDGHLIMTIDRPEIKHTYVYSFTDNEAITIDSRRNVRLAPVGTKITIEA